MVCPFGIFANGKQSILDREPNAFLDKSPSYAGHAGTMGALPDKFFEIANRGERQRNGDAVCLGFFSGHIKKVSLV